MIRNEKLWDEITARLAELVDRDGVEFLPTRDGLAAELSVNVLIGADGEAELQLRNNTITDTAGNGWGRPAWLKGAKRPQVMLVGHGQSNGLLYCECVQHSPKETDRP
jgi:hypothetical protein